MESLRDSVLKLVSEHEGKWSWYQLDRALTSRGIAVHRLDDVLREVKEEGLVEWVPLGEGPHKVMRLTDAGRRAAEVAASRAGEPPLDAALHKYGVDPALARQYQLLCLPENFFSASDARDLRDAGHSLSLYKILKSSGARCANAYALGLNVPQVERRGGDVWGGILWILDEADVPAMLARVARALKPHKPQRIHLEIRVGADAHEMNGPDALAALGELLEHAQVG